VIDHHAPDVIVLTELRPSSRPLLSALRERGWMHQVTGIEQAPVASAGIVSRQPLFALASAGPAEVLPGRWIEAWIPHHEVVIAAVYGPLRNEPFKRFWEAALDALPGRAQGSYAIAGDLNTGEAGVDAPSMSFFCSDYFVGLRNAGLVDVWRSQNPRGGACSYHHRAGGGRDGAGFRLDHLLVSRRLAARAGACHYDSNARARTISDHAPLFAEFRET
jgi:exonuclease III